MATTLLNEFRTFNGSGNNLDDPALNPVTANSDELRIAPANFTPGTTETPIDGPEPRTISNVVSAGDANGDQAGATDPGGTSAMMYVWGQFIDHDLDLESVTGTDPINITVPSDDPTLTPGSTIALNRAVTDPATGTTVNNVSGWLDGSMVYGSDAATADSLRNADGTMKTSGGGNLPIVNGVSTGGDVRASENPDLTAIDTLFVREHNYWVGQLQQQLPDWTGDQLYQMARSIVTAEIENVTYSEFLPKLLGQNAIAPYQGYDSSIDPRITEEFSAAAYRFGHSIVSGTESKLDNSGNVLAQQSLADAFFDTPADVQANGGIDALLRSTVNDNAQANDVYAVPELRNLLAASPDAMDLIAIDVQRESDLGLRSLNQTRQALGLTPYADFNQITSDPAVAANLQQVYGSVDNVDLFMGGLAEDHVSGSMVGSTFEAILTQQFTALRDGDRLWWQNEGFDQNTINQIQNTTLSDIITRNTDTTVVQADAFVARQRHSSDVAATDPTAPQLVIGVNDDNATIAGGPADDTIVAGLGQNQTLTGGGGTDTFVFTTAGNVTDTISDFTTSDIVKFTMIASDFNVTSGANGQAAVTYDGNTLNLNGVTPDQLTASNFVLPSGASTNMVFPQTMAGASNAAAGNT
jgi:peroxidase